MTTPTDYSAKIRSKGLDATGVTEEIAAQMYSRKGAHYMAIVELVVDETHEKADGKRKVDLVITMVEPAVDDSLDDHLRELTRTLHFNRAIDADQPTLDAGDGINPKVSDVIEAGHQHRPHPFLPVDASQDNGICDVCGLVAVAGVHSTQGFLPDDDEEEEEDETGLVDVDPAEPHEFEQGPDGSCLLCGLAEHPDFATDWVDTQHGDEPEQPDEQPDGWTYPQPEGVGTTKPLSAVPDPFTA